MTALAADRTSPFQTWKYKQFTLASGSIAYKGSALGVNAAGKVVPMTSTTAVKFVGVAAEKVDASSADKLVNVELPSELTLVWLANGLSTDAVASTDVGSDCFFADDQTVTITSSGKAHAGKVWGVDSTKGVLVELSKVAGVKALSPVPTPIAFVSNDYVLTAAATVNGGLYDVPTTGAASTVTLPAAAPDGTELVFVADGTKNGHTVQYRDATGPVNLTTALTASKRHRVACSKVGGIWVATAYVSP